MLGALYAQLGRLPITVAHRVELADLISSDLDSPEAWDQIRTTETPFGLPAERATWDAASRGLETRAHAVLEIARSLEARSIASYGVGAAFLEHELARLAPDIALFCSDYTPRTVRRLQALFPEADVRVHDLLRDEPLDVDLTLLHRVDTALTNREWRMVLRRMPRPVLFAPGGLATGQQVARMLLTYRGNRAGFVRTPAAVERVLGPFEKVWLGDMSGYLLRPDRP